MLHQDVQDVARRRLGLSGCRLGDRLEHASVPEGILIASPCDVCGRWAEVLVHVDGAGRPSSGSVPARCAGPRAAAPAVDPVLDLLPIDETPGDDA